MNRSVAIALAMLLGLAGCQGQGVPKPAAQSVPGGVMRVAVEGEFPPFSFIDSGGKLAGFDVDIAQELCTRLQRKCELVQTPFERLIQGLREQKYDVVVASLDITAARSKLVSFSDPYYEIPVYFAGRNGLQIVAGPDGHATPDSLVGLRIAVLDQTSAISYARQHFPGATVMPYREYNGGTTSLMKGDVDLVFIDRLSLQAQMGDQLNAGFQLYGAGYTGPEVTPGEGIAIQKDDDALRLALNAALKQIKADGTFHRIASKYFSFPVFAE